MQIGSLTSSDGTRLASYRWEPTGAPKGDIVLAHGVGEHMGRYQHVAKRLVDAGYRVRGVDFRGHGKSEGKRGYVDEWEQYVDDLRTVIGQDPGPYALFAHSMGTVVSLDHLRDASPWAFVGSAVTVGFAVKAPGWKLAAAQFLSRWLPRLSMSNEIPAPHICSDGAVVEAYLADPLVFSTITPRWFTELLAAFSRIHAATTHYDTPAYVPYGTDDQIIDVAALVEFAAQYGGGMELVPWSGMRHEVLNEPAQDDVIDGILTWLDARCPGA